MKDEIKIKGLSVVEICAKIDDWMDYYNNERYVWDLHKLSPNEYYEWVLNGVWPLGGAAPEPLEFSAFVFQSDDGVPGHEKGGELPPPITSPNPTVRSGRSPAEPYPESG